MIQFGVQMRILVATDPMDMRRGIDKIASVCRLVFNENPMSGTVFLFISRNRKQLRVLTYDGQGFLMATKRLSQGRFPHWPTRAQSGDFLKQLQACEAQVLLYGGNPSQVKPLGDWKKINLGPSFLTGVA